MFDMFEVLMSWKLSWGLSFLRFGVSDGLIFFDFSNYCLVEDIIKLEWGSQKNIARFAEKLPPTE